MKINIGNAVLDLRPGVRMTVSAEGAIIIDVAPLVDQLPAQGGKTQQVKAAKTPDLADDDTRPSSNPGSGYGWEQNQILVALSKQKDPYQWRSFVEIMKLASPRIKTRTNNAPSIAYQRMLDAMKRLRATGEVDYQPAGKGPGQRGRATYRLHKQDEAMTGIDPASVEALSSLNGVISMDH